MNKNLLQLAKETMLLEYNDKDHAKRIRAYMKEKGIEEAGSGI